MAIGVCKLTGSTGELIRSHLIPRALTKPEELGAGLLQAGKGQRPVRRRSSWYDPELVTEEGERFLSALDDWAVEFLRAQKLVWSGWGPMQALGELQAVVPFSPYGIRRIRVEPPTSYAFSSSASRGEQQRRPSLISTTFLCPQQM
jgi:hypothetical protein